MTEYFRVFNDHAVPRMMDMVADSVELIYLDERGGREEVRGREALARSLHGYFAAYPTVRSELLAMETVGPYVAVHERAVWRNDSAWQTSVSLYQIQDDVIERVWFLPADRP